VREQKRGAGGDNRITIRRITRSCFESFHSCLDSVCREKKYLAFPAAPPLTDTLLFLEELFLLEVPQYVAQLPDGTVVGWIDVVPGTIPGYTHSGKLGMGIQKNFRGNGLGTRLLKKGLEAARSRGLERIELEVYASNHRAIRLYQKFGFIEEGIKKQGRKYNNRYDDLVMMALLLQR